MKTVLLCNHPLALGSIEELIKRNFLAGLATPLIMHDTTMRIQMIANQYKIPYIAIEQQDISNQLGNWLSKIRPDVAFVLTFPYKIPANVLKIPKHGFFNWHTGILPEFRGPDPIFWEILNQEQFGGITIHQMDQNFDTGPIVYIDKVPILPEDTYGQHIQKLAISATKCTHFLLEKLTSDPASLRFYRQDDQKADYQKRPDFMDLIIDWDKDSSQHIKALTRASNPIYGGAISFFRGVPVHLLQVSIGSLQSNPGVKPGTIIASGIKEGIVVYTSDQKILRLDVLYTEDGFFTGGKLAAIFDIKAGEQFTGPPVPPSAPKT
ncbi:MAG: formyltransferase family protein [Candidatus Caenarcaniphilales bacterium]|nr:formyltransferase family protein [Candidatus Caenarcaniphilales bacterium]